MKANVAASTLAMVLGSVTSALAASGAREDNSGVLVWIFLGFCALIIVAQLAPAVLTMIGMAKGVADSVGRKAEAKN
ncbi:hypothetical protein KIP69_16795 [Geobacter sulfurreducens]|jgi:hypothetical protein|uniref:Holin n=2 Tax=Geobacter TaxID=28231 RepID=Q746V8_GEOSL|nr:MULTISPECIES: hypothetical protein [Geobacter]MCF0398203.1 hypothetical protein [Klebsiella pneumoniae]AAR36800.1 hypothetical protein GSU3410 [Geobacter sulfurreducens PCA]ADI86167.1 hypothetical protein KN400_3355 [Geobacter sulfurreducens KN400]AJY69664.1 hypothetical protein RW64_08620 [Geobacter sulfurreducens]MBE2889335.1 hypothetical protein [Geobacter anodireducens]